MRRRSLRCNIRESRTSAVYNYEEEVRKLSKRCRYLISDSQMLQKSILGIKMAGGPTQSSMS